MVSGIPLSSGDMVLPSGAVLPSGEANFLDLDQYGKAINATYPSPTNFVDDSGTYIGKDLNADLIPGSEITDSTLSPVGLDTPFSNTEDAASGQISDFTIFNKYIHYYPRHVGGQGTGQASRYIPVYIDYTMAFEQAAPWGRYVDRVPAEPSGISPADSGVLASG